MKYLVLLAVLWQLPFNAFAEKINLSVSGNEKKGYNVNIYYGSDLVSSQDLSGELDLVLENEDYSVKEVVKGWKATKILQEGNKTTLSGSLYLKKLETDLDIDVIYEIVTDKVIKKTVELSQVNVPHLYYSLSLGLHSTDTPTSFWSFDDNDNLGGVVHETYPAAGYMLNENLAVGLLTDAGDKNLWTRNIRRRPSKQGEIGFKAIQEICDANLIEIARDVDRNRKDNWVKYTFGEVSDFNHPKELVEYKLPLIDSWKLYNGAVVKQIGDLGESIESSENIEVIKNEKGFVISGKAKSSTAGVKIPCRLSDGFYTLSFKHRSTTPLSIRLLKKNGEKEEVVGLHYQTDLPSSKTEWVEQEETVFLANTEGGITNLMLSASSLKENEFFKLEIKDFKLIRSDGERYAYHRLEQGKKAVKKVFIFAAPAQPTLHDLRLASQVYLADGLGFEGSTEEKCLFSCYQMLMWITSRDNFTPLNVPSINYAPDMYNRDSFWSLMGVYDKVASEQIFNAWAATQDRRGAIGTIITPCMGSREVKGNEATLEFLWFALVNHRLYGTPLPMEKLKKAYDFCIQEFDPDGDGICHSEFVLGQNDVVTYPEKTSDLSVNQGMFAVTLQVAKELGLNVSQDYIEKANQEYRNFYDYKNKYLIDNRAYPHSITYNSLLPEFASWWLFNKPILTAEMVINTLEKFPYKNGYSPLICHKDNIYFTQKDKPFSPEMFWDNGIYYNAGSWMREEICGYVAGLKHGWEKAESRIRERLHTEITLHPDEPFSHEFLPYDLSVKDCWWPSTRVFSWNVFVLRAMEVAGLRKPSQDPGFNGSTE